MGYSYRGMFVQIGWLKDFVDKEYYSRDFNEVKD